MYVSMYCHIAIIRLMGAPPKDRLLEHQQPKDRVLKHRLAKTSSVDFIDLLKNRSSKTSTV
jgi:hypothetical protein